MVSDIANNCPAHQSILSTLKAVNLVFLLPNTTAKLYNLKVHFRNYHLLKLLVAIEGKSIFT